MRPAFWAALLTATSAATATAQDFQVGARAKGMGGSYTAFEDDPVAVWLNPAGTAKQKYGISLEYQTFTQYELERSDFIGTEGEAEAGLTDPPVIPSFLGIIAPFETKGLEHAVSVALIRPFQNRLTYDFPAPPAFIAQTDQQFWRLRLAYALGFKLGDESRWFTRAALGLAGDIAYTRFDFRSYTTAGLETDHINDTDTQAGWGAGMLLTVFDDGASMRLDFGAAYQSAVDFSLQQDEQTFASWDWPPMVNAGATLYLLGQALRFTVDVQWIGWDRATEDSTHPTAPDFENALNWSVGLEYQYDAGAGIWLIPRIGYRHYDAPWDDPDDLPAIGLTRLAIDTEDGEFELLTFGAGVRWQNEAGAFRGFDFGVEAGGDATNFAFGYIHQF
jgi:hypothetical protein